MFLFSLKLEVFQFSSGDVLPPLNPLFELESIFHVAHCLVKFYIRIRTLFLCIFYSLLSFGCTDTHKCWALSYRYIYIFFFFFCSECVHQTWIRITINSSGSCWPFSFSTTCLVKFVLFLCFHSAPNYFHLMILMYFPYHIWKSLTDLQVFLLSDGFQLILYFLLWSIQCFFFDKTSVKSTEKSTVKIVKKKKKEKKSWT